MNAIKSRTYDEYGGAMVDGHGRKAYPSLGRRGCGGTTFGLHCAVNEIQSGGRVLWASPEMPNAIFSLFASLNIVESSRFPPSILSGLWIVRGCYCWLNMVARVGLVVLDDWCAPTGRIEDNLDAVFDLQSE